MLVPCDGFSAQAALDTSHQAATAAQPKFSIRPAQQTLTLCATKPTTCAVVFAWL
jgi:hypothetical protein